MNFSECEEFCLHAKIEVVAVCLENYFGFYCTVFITNSFWSDAKTAVLKNKRIYVCVNILFTFFLPNNILQESLGTD